MGQELNLDQLADAMRDQQDGNNNGKKVVWDSESGSFVELGAYEQPKEKQSVMNDVSRVPYYSL